MQLADSSCELVETEKGSESRKPLDDLGESFPELDKFVDSYQYYAGDKNTYTKRTWLIFHKFNGSL